MFWWPGVLVVCGGLVIWWSGGLVVVGWSWSGGGLVLVVWWSGDGGLVICWWVVVNRSAHSLKVNQRMA